MKKRERKFEINEQRHIKGAKEDVGRMYVYQFVDELDKKQGADAAVFFMSFIYTVKYFFHCHYY